MAKQKQRELKVGDRFTFIDDPRQRPHVVLRVSPCSAIVRSEVGSHEVIRNDDGSIKAEFDRPGPPPRSASPLVRQVPVRRLS